MIYVLIQIIIAIIIIVLMGVLAYGMYNKNAREILLDIITPITIKKKTQIIDGVYEYKVGNKISFNTRDKSKGTYVDLSPSINQKGGSVYSYNFWLYFPNTVGEVSENRTLVLFNKGSNELVKYNSDYRCDTNDNDQGWFLVKNPLVRLDFNVQKIDAIIVEFNSIQNPDVFHSGANTGDKNCSGDMVTKDNNLIGIKDLANRQDLKEQWNMITVVVSETSPEDDVFVSTNQAVVKLYLNGYAYLNKDGELVDKSTAMKTNNSDLHIGTDKKSSDNSALLSSNADNKTTNIGISDLTYFNYTLEDTEIINLFKGGCNKSTALIPTESDFDTDPEATNASLEMKAHTDPKSL
mgnify:CR=1 FL=1|tara:strand:+ start:10051 stop:11103 length:1053 start_codon:yes stop_codon:yes gene_type:complete